MSNEMILLVVAVLVVTWQAINLIITLSVLPTKHLVGQDRLLAAYFALTFIASGTTIVFLALHLAKSTGLLK